MTVAEPATAVILAAGLGSRLGLAAPKPLTPLRDGRTIIQQQLDHIRAELPSVTTVLVVVGFGKDQVIAQLAGQADFVDNDRYRETNTAKSLLAALGAAPDGGILWLNGDVVFSPGLLAHIKPRFAHGSFVAVNTAVVGEEEVKYTLDANGNIDQLSKQVVNGLGEAVGINFIAGPDRAVLGEALAAVGDQDYFEKGLERVIADGSVAVKAVDVAGFGVVEVDFTEDLDRANTL
ncbi:MAG: UDP-N-acetylglucosamine pyrophosphorylase [Pseudonocardiales bacterium]|nr:UDP-N-acetylglucosamine pyrophosphorylase [Jatrophihabitantaceae bacterium]MCW2603120.1 UDP-N-acetylglucosamine pyrophosphorylase [Pseudonocardiales bacterium]